MKLGEEINGREESRTKTYASGLETTYSIADKQYHDKWTILREAIADVLSTQYIRIEDAKNTLKRAYEESE